MSVLRHEVDLKTSIKFKSKLFLYLKKKLIEKMSSKSWGLV